MSQQGLNPTGPVTRGVENLATASPVAGEMPEGMYLAAAPVLTNRMAHPLRLNASAELMTSSTVVPPAPGTLSTLQAAITVAAGTTAIVAAPAAGLRIYVWQMVLAINSTAGTCTMQLLSAATPLTGAMPYPTGGGFGADAPGGIRPVYTCGLAEALNITMVAGNCAGSLIYTVAA